MKVDLRVTPLGAGGEYYIKGTIELPEEIVELLKRLAYPPMLFEEGSPPRMLGDWSWGREIQEV